MPTIRQIEAGRANIAAQRWQPGKSANPGGKPKGTPSIPAIIARMLAMTLDEWSSFQPANAAEQIALQRVKDAARDCVISDTALKATALILDRVEGPVKHKEAIEDVAATVCAKAVESFAFYSQLNDKYAAKYGVSLTRAELLDSIVRPLAPQHQQIAVDAIDEAFPQATEDHQLESIP